MKLSAKYFKIYHPFLFAIFPVVFLYSSNKEQVLFRQTLVPIALTLIGAIIVLIVAKAVLKNYEKSAIATSFLLLVFFSYGPIDDALNGLLQKKVHFHLEVALLTVLPVLYALVIHIISKRLKNIGSLTILLNVVSVCLVAFSLSQVTIYKFHTRFGQTNPQTQTQTGAKVASADSPDIYYIILDGYASNQTLKDDYGFDNQGFTDSLDKLGFYVAPQSHSNYAITYLSLASSLNMNYINNLSDKPDSAILYRLISNSKIADLLQSKGYRFVSFDSGWGPTEKSINSGSSFSEIFGDEFQMTLFHSSMLRPLENYWYIGGYIQRQRILNTFSGLAEVSHTEEPTFAFAHILCPHPPYVFDEAGNLAVGTKFSLEGDVWLQKDNYLNQLKFMDKKVLNLVGEIKENSTTEPIIIIQGDHGTASTFYPTDGQDKWAQPDSANLKERMGILNAYLLPGGAKEKLYPSITPVNSFRLVFKNVFGDDLNLLEDKNYFSSEDNPFQFLDATSAVNQK